MCGISGAFLIKRQRTKEQLEDIRKIVSQLVVETAKRGKDSTGISVINKDRFYLWKSPQEADDFVFTEKFQETINAIDNNTSAILSHNRAMTKGDEKVWFNNHPIVCGRTIGIHNGVISNDDEVFKETGEKRIGEVDSEAIFSSIEHNRKKKKKLTDAFKRLDGRFGIAFLDRREPDKCYLATNSVSMSPIHYGLIEELGVWIYASEEKFIDKTMQTFRLYTGKNYKIDVKEAENKKMITFHLENKRMTKCKFEDKPYEPYTPPEPQTTYQDYSDPTSLPPRRTVKSSNRSIFDEFDEADIDTYYNSFLRGVFGEYDDTLLIYSTKRYLFIKTTMKMSFARTIHHGVEWYIIRNKIFETDTVMNKIINDILKNNRKEVLKPFPKNKSGNCSIEELKKRMGINDLLEQYDNRWAEDHHHKEYEEDELHFSRYNNFMGYW